MDDLRSALAAELAAEYPDGRFETKQRISVALPRIDIWAETPRWTAAIEVIYRTKALNAVIGNERYQLKNHAAQDLARYDFVRDVVRLEGVASAVPGVMAFALLLTNDPQYWREPTRRGVPVDEAFRLHEGAVLNGHRAWGLAAASGTTKGREHRLEVRGTYRVKWRDYAVVDDSAAGTFRYLAVRVASFAEAAG
jgi:hypothetical protein